MTLSKAGGAAVWVAAGAFAVCDAPLSGVWLYAERLEHNEIGKELGTFCAWPMRFGVRAQRRSGDDTAG